MKQIFLHHTGQPRLLLFFAGWGADEHLFPYTPPAGYDLLLCYDYTDEAFDYSLLEPYTEIRLLAWSLGVWTAARTLSGHTDRLTQCLALNGTLHPIDDTRGIPSAIFEGTLVRFTKQNLYKFRRRMCGTAKELMTFMDHCPQRTPESLRAELAALHHRILSHPEPQPFSWDHALIGAQDLIFPTTNQQNAWSDVPQLVLPGVAHYDGHLFAGLIEGKEELWTSR